MKRIAGVSGIIMLTGFFIASCGGGTKDDKGKTNDLKVKLEKLKKQKNDLDADIRKLEDQIAKADPKAAQQVFPIILSKTSSPRICESVISH